MPATYYVNGNGDISITKVTVITPVSSGSSRPTEGKMWPRGSK